MNLPGPRPKAQPIDRGEWKPLVVYMAGDVVEYEGDSYRAVHDHRSGFLPPPIVIDDTDDTFWEVVP